MPRIKDGTLNNFYNTSYVQYVIPPYQRTITWPSDQWEALLNDIFYIMNDKQKTHLIQMFQLQTDTTGSKHIVGDGQQRLVHTSLIFIALAYAIKSISIHHSVDTENVYRLKAFYEKILSDRGSTQAAMLSFFEGTRKTKVIVGPSNRKTYESLIAWDYDSLPSKNDDKCIIQHAFEFYRKEITIFLLGNLKENFDLVNQSGLLNYEKNILGDINEIYNRASSFLNTMEYRLVFAAAYFDSREEMQASYENTNSRSVALTESELIKNNIFKNFDPLETQERLVKDYWNYFDNNYWIYKDLGDKNLYDKKSQKRPDSDRLDDLFYYHLTAAMRQYGAFIKKEHHATFKAFKDFYETASADAYEKEITKNPNTDRNDFISDYYENVLKVIKKQGELYRGLEEGIFSNSDDSFERRAQDFYYRVIDACNLKAAVSILFVLQEKNLDNETNNKILDLIESFVIRKALSNNAVSAVSIYRFVFKHLKKDSINYEDMKNELSKETNKTTSWEGNHEIIQHQLKKIWKSNEHCLASLLIIDFENKISGGIARKHSYKSKDSTIEHFMPQNPVKSEDWPISGDVHGVRDRLTYNFGNLFVMPADINGKLGNLSLKSKKEFLKKHLDPNGSLGYVSLDFAFRADKWEQIQIENSLRERLNQILQKYEGPKSTASKFDGTPLLKDGIIEPNEKIFYTNSRHEEFEVIVHEDGSFFYNQNSYGTFSQLMKIIDPSVRHKNYNDIWSKKIGTQKVKLSKYLNLKYKNRT